MSTTSSGGCCGGRNPGNKAEPGTQLATRKSPVVEIIDTPQFNVTVRTNVNGFKEYLVKVVLLGDSGVGKSCLIHRFKSATFSEEFKPTIGVDFTSKILTVGNSSVQLQIWDTAGQERFRAIATTYYRGASAAIIVFDITRKQSFSNLRRWISEMQKAADFSQRPVILTIVGNKTDLKDSREVFQSDVDEFIAENNLNARYVEASAKDGSGVDDAFAWIAETVTSTQAPPAPAAGNPHHQPKDIEPDVRKLDLRE